ncbi:MAG: hypothetical protein NXI10_02695 [bacterium]|nr:hypothetical protein [bacterium]
MKTWLILLNLIFLSSIKAQTNLVSPHSFYKDQTFANKQSQPFNSGDFFPYSEASYDLLAVINDSSKQYYDVTETLFKKHLFELKGDGYYLTISPAFNFSVGTDLKDTSNTRLTRNTRGFLIEGDLLDKVSFSTSFYENQATFARYASNYFADAGELYLNQNGYFTQNAVIPGEGRTKDFKESGYDFGYAIGNVVYKPWRRLTIAVGNNSHFIGSGHRSLLLSDNSYAAPYFRIDWNVLEKFQVRVLRAKLLNLLRRPFTSSAESYYEAKGYSVNYLTWMPTEKLNVSLFEGVIWNRGDSVSYQSAHPLFYNPVPGIAGLLGSNEVNSMIGINASWQVKEKHRFYGQVAVPNWKFERTGFQAGYRGYNFFGWNDFMFQLEYNYIPEEMYGSQNPRLNYVHYNLPLGHIRGDGIQEILVRSNYEYKRAYVDLLVSFMMLQNYNPRGLLPTNALIDPGTEESFNTTNVQLEIGYRFNRKMNFSVFARSVIRQSTAENPINGTIFQMGMRTAIINQYDDF